MAGGTPLVVGIDVGQTAVKAVVYDETMRQLSLGRSVSPIDRPAPRCAERSQDALWEAVVEAVADALRDSRVDPSLIGAVALSGHGDGLHLIDTAGNPVSPAITAMDGRAWREASEIAEDQGRSRTILRLSGQSPGAWSPGCLLLWAGRNRPEWIDRADAIVFCKDVVRIRLTGEVCTDYSDATASFLDTDAGAWSHDVLDAYGIGGLDRLLPELRESAAPAGTVRPEAAERTGIPEGTPVLNGMHDVHASAIGMGSLRLNAIACVAGSFSTNGVTTRQKDTDPRWQSRLSITPDLRIAMSTSSTASPTLDWVLRLLGATAPSARDALIEQAAALPLDRDAPTVLPYFAGSPPGVVASGVIAGLRGEHGPEHLMRAVLEGIALMHHWHVSALAEAFVLQGDVALGGGISRSSTYARFVANALDRPVRVSLEEEPGAFGAAALAAVHLGLFETIDEAQAHARLADRIDPDPALASYWADARAAFDALGPAMTPWWKERADAIGA